MGDRLNKATGSILIVEDSKTQAEYLRAILEEDGYSIVLAKNGWEALKQIAVDRPLMVLTDIIMPDMGGYELCRRIKQDTKSSAIPVILVTRLYYTEDVIKGLAAGADDFIIKPFKPAYIRSRIHTILSHMENPEPDEVCSTLEVTFAKTTHVISSSRLQILNVLLSIYEAAVNNNWELQEAQEELNASNEELVSTNEQLLQAVTDLRTSNLALEQENRERKRVEKALDEANKKLNLVSSITRHDIRNQLLALNCYIQLGKESINNPEQLPQIFEKEQTIANVLEDQINFTKDYEETGVKAPVWHTLKNVINDAANALHLKDVRVDYGCDGLQLLADPLFSKAIYNLVDNALRHGEHVASVRFSTSRDGDVLLLICEDDGVGVPYDMKEQIFLRGVGKNTGLGLFLVREILSPSGLSITEEGLPGKGARFVIRVPKGKFQETG